MNEAQNPEPASPPPPARPIAPSRDGRGIRARTRAAALKLRPFTKYFPYLSLAVGVLSALLMDRSPQVASLIVAVALLGFFFAFVLAVFTDGVEAPPDFHPGDDDTAGDRPPEVSGPLGARALYFVLLWLLQSALCQVLFFVVPHYARAMQWLLGHVVFLASTLVCGVVLLWDPLFVRVMRRPLVRFLLVSYVAFVGLNAVLPALGFKNSTSLIMSSAAAALGGALFAGLRSDAGHRVRTTVAGFVVAAALFVVAAVLGAAIFLPPAPLQLGGGGLGTAYEDFTLSGQEDIYRGVPDALFCASSVIAPRGLTDGIVHVWTWEGTETDRIPLGFDGGRRSGFRTYSRKTQLRPGRIGCIIETEFGQQLGAFHVDVFQDLDAD